LNYKINPAGFPEIIIKILTAGEFRAAVGVPKNLHDKFYN